MNKMIKNCFTIVHECKLKNTQSAVVIRNTRMLNLETLLAPVLSSCTSVHGKPKHY